MTRVLRQGFVAAILAAAVSAATVDLNETITLVTNTSLDLDTGKTAASGGDIFWNGTTIAPEGKATAVNIGKLASFKSLGKSYFDIFRKTATAAEIPAKKLVATDVFAVFTNDGNTAGVQVTANSGGSITLQFITFISGTPTVPIISQILNNSSRIQPGAPNYGIAPSSLFIIIGGDLADQGTPVLQSTAAPGLPITLNGASITVTVNGKITHPPIYYTSPTQIGAVLPAATPVGTGTITVTYRGQTSNAATIQVVASAPGINTYLGAALATDAVTGAIITYTNSGKQGQTILLWATGLGADPADSDTTYTSTPHTLSIPLQVYIGGVSAKIVYKGASTYPGVDLIGLVIPKSMRAGCYVSLAVVANNVLSNTVILPVSESGGACFEPQNEFTGNQISPPNGQSIRGGLVALIQTNTPNKDGTRKLFNSTDAAFEKYTGVNVPKNSVSPGGCIINDLTPVPIPKIEGLDVGSITLTGPGGLDVKLASQGIKGAFYAILPNEAITDAGGTYIFKGTGGKDVGAFTSTISFTAPLLKWTNPEVAVSVDRSKDLTVKWTGGNPGTYVFVLGGVVSRTGPDGAFTCLAAVDDGKFTVPSYILSALPAGTGAIQLQHQVHAALPASGIDAGIAIGDISYSMSGTFK
jgi:uncharacterized protein (TIGR03437 family)